MQLHLNTSQATLFLPKVELMAGLKKVVVSGRSRMPDPSEYYNEFANTLADYYHEFDRTLFIEFYFDYINTGSSKWLLFVLQYLESLYVEHGGLIEITWKYDDDDETIIETGEVLKSQLKIPIILKIA